MFVEDVKVYSAEKMQKNGADIVKIATTAKDQKDLLTILRLAENLQRKNIRQGKYEH